VPTVGHYDRRGQEAVFMVQTHEEQLLVDPNLRPTGIPPIGPLPWGSHICMFYETPEDLIDAHGEYFGAGLVDNERCIWVLSGAVDHDRAIQGMRTAIPGFDHYLAAGAIELIPGNEWYLQEGKIDPRRVTDAWLAKQDEAVAQGLAGLRVSGNAFWLDSHRWGSFMEYEEELQRSIGGARIVVLCTYPLPLSRAADLLDVARAHHVAVTRRNGKWEFVESSQLAEARREISRLNNAIDILSRPFPGHELLTPRERAALAQIVKGASNKEAARALGISPRTIEFHRTNILRKLNVRNVVELVSVVLGAERQ
jgi:DNA-binding CsgD family transcriptional regulator